MKLGRTLRQHREGVLAAISLRLSNGSLKGLNSKIGVFKHRAYGFHSFAALAAMVFPCCTDLQLKLTHLKLRSGRIGPYMSPRSGERARRTR